MSVIDSAKSSPTVVADAITGSGPKGALLRFYMDGCGHCKNMDPVWKECATKLDAPVVDIEAKDIQKVRDVLKTLVQSKGGFPQIFKVNDKGEAEGPEFAGDRNVTDIVNFFTGKSGDTPSETSSDTPSEDGGQTGGGRRRRTRRRSRRGDKKSRKGNKKSRKSGKKSSKSGKKSRNLRKKRTLRRKKLGGLGEGWKNADRTPSKTRSGLAYIPAVAPPPHWARK